MGYYVYRIPEINKVGLAKNLENRVEDQQGWLKDEYETLGYFVTLKQARAAELLFQKEYDCIDTGEGNDIIDAVIKNQSKKQDVTVSTEHTGAATVGFYIDWKDAKDALANGCTFRLDTGDIKATGEDVKALFANDTIKESHNGGWGKGLHTYAIVKKVKNYFNNKIQKPKTNESGSLDDLISLVHAWADDRGILDGNITTQTLKLGEEFGELQKAVLKDRPEEVKDAIGDIIVVLVSIAHFNGHSVADAVRMAYDTISKRTGYTNAKGDFIKTKFDGKEIKDTL